MHKAHEKLGLALDLSDDLTQGDLENFYRVMRSFHAGWLALSNLERAGFVTRAAARLGWLDGLKEPDVGELPPAKAQWLGREIEAHLYRLTLVPPE